MTTRMISRRRFLTISAAALATPAAASAPIRWQGHAMGAQASLTINAPPPLASRAIAVVQRALAHAEAQFSLYRPNSALSRLNRNRRLNDPHADFTRILQLVDTVHAATGGAFDPTVQPLWQALSNGQPTDKAIAAIGWSRVRHSPAGITLGTGQALTLNGIAQGFVTDQIAKRLRKLGLTDVLIDMGEFAALGGPWQLGLSDPAHGIVEHVQIQDRAVATSSPDAMHLGAAKHILNPKEPALAQWSTVSVEADSAALADAASTAFTLMPQRLIKQAKHHLPGLHTIRLVGADGAVSQA